MTRPARGRRRQHTPMAGGALLLVMLLVGLDGCGGLTQVQDSITKFDQGTHSAATAELRFLQAVQTADCTAQFYLTTYNWAIGAARTFDLSGVCTPTILDDQQIQIRQDLMNAITLYADKMAALATNDNNKTLDTNSQHLAQHLNAIAKQHGFSNLPVAAAVESAIIAISEMALDQRRFSDIKGAATTMAPRLTAVVSSLKIENTTFAAGIASKMDYIEEDLRPILAATRATRAQISFFDVVRARAILQSANPFTPLPLSATAGAVAAKSDPANVAQQLNVTLDDVLNANHAIATGGTGGIIAAVNDLIARAQAAQTLYTALSK